MDVEPVVKTPRTPSEAVLKSTTVEQPDEASDLFNGRHRQKTLMFPKRN